MIASSDLMGMLASGRGQTAMALRLPTIFPREMADAGGLFSYSTSLRTATRHMAQYVKNVLEGAKPGEMPICTLSAHELVVNCRPPHDWANGAGGRARQSRRDDSVKPGSALGQTRHFDRPLMTSGLPPETDILKARRHASNAPQPDIQS
jgi:hypothetical protein